MKSRRTPISYGLASAAQAVIEAMEERTTPASLADLIERLANARSVRQFTGILRCSDQTIYRSLGTGS